jgi:hypothetical protein
VRKNPRTTFAANVSADLALRNYERNVEEFNNTCRVANQGLPEGGLALISSGKAKRGLFAMDLFSFAGSFGAFQLDDSSVAMIALLAGMYGGYWINGRHTQLKAKRAKIARAPQRKS